MTAGLCPSNFFQEKTTYRLKCNFCIQWFHIYICRKQARKRGRETHRWFGIRRPSAPSCLPPEHMIYDMWYISTWTRFLMFNYFSFAFAQQFIPKQVIADRFKNICKFHVRGIPPVCISSCGLRNPLYCLYTGNFTIQLKLYYTAETLLYSCNFTIQL